MGKRPKNRQELNAAVRRGVEGKRKTSRTDKRFDRWAKGQPKPKDGTE